MKFVLAPVRVCPKCHTEYDPPATRCSFDGATLLNAGDPTNPVGPAASRPPVSPSPPVPSFPPVSPSAPVSAMEAPDPALFEDEDDEPAEDTPPMGIPILPPSLGNLGPYRLIAVLGEGTMAKVYSAEHSKLGRRSAIKRLKPEHLVNQEMVQRFLAEARTIASIQHPNLVTIYDVVEEPGEVYLVMELLDGRDIESALGAGAFSVDRALRVAAEICDALSSVHVRGIVHRDVKPANVYLCIVRGREQVKMLDFGAARLLHGPVNLEERMQREGTTLGSPIYMSPEQIAGDDLDARSDVYSVGVMLYEMLSGKPPFSGDVLSDVMLQHVHAEPKPLVPLGVPREVEQVVMRCLAKKAADRYSSSAELARELRRVGAAFGLEASSSPHSPMSPPAVIIDQSLLQAAPVSAITPSVQPQRASRNWLAIGSVVFAMSIVSASIALALRPRSPIAAVTEPQAAVAPANTVAVVTPTPVPTAPAVRKVHVESEPPSMAVPEAGYKLCHTPCDIEVPATRTAITFKAPGFLNLRVELAEGETQAHIRLTPEPSPTSSPTVVSAIVPPTPPSTTPSPITRKAQRGTKLVKRPRGGSGGHAGTGGKGGGSDPNSDEGTLNPFGP